MELSGEEKLLGAGGVKLGPPMLASIKFDSKTLVKKFLTTAPEIQLVLNLSTRQRADKSKVEVQGPLLQCFSAVQTSYINICIHY